MLGLASSVCATVNCQPVTVSVHDISFFNVLQCCVCFAMLNGGKIWSGFGIAGFLFEFVADGILCEIYRRFRLQSHVFNTNNLCAFCRKEIFFKIFFVWDFLKDPCTSLPVYFFILLYIDATACVDLVYFCLFDMKKVFSWLVWKQLCIFVTYFNV